MRGERSCFVLALSTALALLTAASAIAQVPITFKPAGRESLLTFGGLLQVQADAGDRGDSRFADDNDRFYLRRARLNATGRFLEEIDFRLELDLAGSLGNTTGLRAQLTDGYINWNRYDAVNIRVGQFKTPFGFEQLYSDPRLTTAERSLVNDRLTLSRQLGVQVGGDLFERRLSYALGAFNGNAVNNNFNDNDKFALVGRLSGNVWNGQLGSLPASWSVGGSAYRTDDTALSLAGFGFDSTPTTADRDNLFSGSRRGLSLDSQVQLGRFELWVEDLQSRFEPTNRRPAATLDAAGWYVQGSYLVVPQRLQVVAKYETFDPDDSLDADDTNTQTYGVNFFLKGQDLKLLLDYLHSEVPGTLPAQDKVIARIQVIF